jgi:hypothetical protein
MFLSKKHIPRRTFLRGGAVTLALPLLDAMVPAGTLLAQTAARPKSRFAGIFVPHGMAPGYWVPSSDGSGFTFPMVFTPLEKFRDRTVILSGLHGRSSEPPPGVSGADHWVAAAFLCANKPRKTVGADVYAGTTVDQVIAQTIGQDTLMPSMQLAVEDPGSSGNNCGEGYSCAYTNTISWQTPTKPLPMELNPQVIFERMFGDGSTADERARRRQEDRSILDSLTHGLARFRVAVGPTDRRRLDEYTEDVREIERRLQIAAKASEVSTTMDTPSGIPESFDEHIKLQYDLMALAFRADITRVATLLYARDLTSRVFPASGIDRGFHGLSHHGENPKSLLELATVNRYHIQLLANFVEKLKASPDGDGTLLDHSLILYGSNMGNSNQHVHYDVPHVLVGGASGALRGDRHLAYPSKTVPTGNLLVSVLDLFGIHRPEFGDSTGRLENL